MEWVDPLFIFYSDHDCHNWTDAVDFFDVLSNSSGICSESIWVTHELLPGELSKNYPGQANVTVPGKQHNCYFRLPGNFVDCQHSGSLCNLEN
jgi:hypothetical protein